MRFLCWSWEQHGGIFRWMDHFDIGVRARDKAWCQMLLLWKKRNLDKVRRLLVLHDRLHAEMEPLGRTKGKDRRKLLFVRTLNNSSNHAVLTASLTLRNMTALRHELWNRLRSHVWPLFLHVKERLLMPLHLSSFYNDFRRNRFEEKIMLAFAAFDPCNILLNKSWLRLRILPVGISAFASALYCPGFFVFTMLAHWSIALC